MLLLVLLISDGEGSEIVRLARRAVETYLRESTIIKHDKDDGLRAGVFVTLNYLTRKKEEHLRGCIGFPLPDKMLRQSVIEAAIAAATEDPRFPPVDIQELDDMIFEVSVLTPPQEIRVSPDEYRKEIKIGKDGLILRWRFGSGLLLPQVPIEMKWDIDQYLANICYKAGAPVDAWKDRASKLYKFQAIVFKEREPRGKIIRLEL